MLGLKKKSSDTDGRVFSHSALIAISASIDELDKHECSPDAIGSCLMTVLRKMGISDEDALCASIEATKMLDASFSALYWKENSVSNKVAVFTSTLEATIMLVERGLISERVRQKAKETIAEHRQRGDNIFG